MRDITQKQKNMIFAGIITVLVGILLYGLYSTFRHVDMTYEGMYEVNVTSSIYHHHARHNKKTEYNVTLTCEDPAFRLNCDSYNKGYYDSFSSYNGSTVKAPVFKIDDTGEYFVPPTLKECTETKASKYYLKFFDSNPLKPILIFAIAIGLVLIAKGIKDTSSDSKIQTVQTVPDNFFDNDAANYQMTEEEKGRMAYYQSKMDYQNENNLRSPFSQSSSSSMSFGNSFSGSKGKKSQDQFLAEINKIAAEEGKRNKDK